MNAINKAAMKKKLLRMLNATKKLYNEKFNGAIELAIIDPVYCDGIEFENADVTLVHDSGNNWRIDLAYTEEFVTFNATTDAEAIEIFVREIDNWNSPAGQPC